ncbi:MAG: alkene reductase, partial [Plesiomonas sp.]
MKTLMQPYALNTTLTLANRFVMAPLTRCMADQNLVPTQQIADYYARRADVGLLISEGVIIRPDAQGYPNTPGLFTDAQIAGWKNVTDAVHAKKGKIFAQLWHVGRVSHSHFHGQTPVAPSAIALEGTLPRMRELSYPVPRALSITEIAEVTEQFAQAAENAMKAGFDGVEIHGANGYLIDQFLHYSSNSRTD